MSSALMICCLIMIIAVFMVARERMTVAPPNPALASLYGIYTTTDTSAFDLLPRKM